jgi:hypothetical protein
VTNSLVNGTYLAVQQQLPADPTLEGFSSSNQIGVAQLAIQYCNQAVTNTGLQAKLFGTTLAANQFATPAGVNTVTSALAARVLASGPHPPAATTVTTELSSLIGKLCTTNNCNLQAGTNAVAAAACATALGSADMLIN